MKVTVIDCSVSGHRETYYKQFAQTWAGMGYETSLIAPDGKGIQEAVAFQPVSALPLLPLPAPESSTAESRSGLLCLPRRYAAYIGSLMAVQSFAALSVERPAGSVRPAALPPRDARHPPFPAKQELRRSRHTERIFSERPGNISAPHSAVSRLCRSFGSRLYCQRMNISSSLRGNHLSPHNRKTTCGRSGSQGITVCSHWRRFPMKAVSMP